MCLLNKAKEVREILDLTPTQAGRLLFGYKAKQAYDMWSGWENGTRKPSLSTEKYFDLILFLNVMKNFNTSGAENAFDIFIATLEK